MDSRSQKDNVITLEIAHKSMGILSLEGFRGTFEFRYRVPFQKSFEIRFIRQFRDTPYFAKSS